MLPLTLALLALAVSCLSPASARPIELHFDEHDMVELYGPWEFYWEEFLDPKQSSHPQPTARVELPGSWTQIRNEQGPLPAAGYGTYRMTLRLQGGNNSNLILRVPMVYSAYRLFINGTLAAQVGTPADSAEQAVPDYGEQLIPIPQHQDEIELTFHVSNFTSRNAGFPYPLELGTSSSIYSAIYMDLITKAVLAGGLMLIGLARMAFFAVLRRELAHLFFGLAVFSTSLHIVISERFLDFLGWHLPIHLARLFDGLTILIAGTAFIQFLAAFFPQHLPARLTRWFLLAPLLYLFAALAVSDLARSQFIGWLLYLIVGAIGLSLFAIIRACYQRQPDSGLILAASACVFAAGFLQIAQYNETGIRINPVDAAVLISVLLYNFALARRYARAFERSKRLEFALGRANRLKDEFLANTSHELRTPLHAMIGLAESLPRENETLAKGLALIVDSGRRLSRLLDDILSLTRLNHDDITLEPKPVHLGPIVHAVLDACQPLVTSRPVKLCSEVEDNLPLVMVDPDRIHQVLFNLVGNAIKFTDEGSVTVQVKTLNNRVRVDVIDTGIGLPATDWERLQLSYEQGAESSLEGRGGMGLGLAISRKILALHGSKLELDSTTDQSTQIHFELPGVPGSLDATSAESPLSLSLPPQLPIHPIASARNSNGSSPLILVVDDDENSALVLETQLSLAGYRTVKANSAAKALEIIHDRRPNLVMLDVMMPDMSGLALCRHIREELDANSLPVILVTARSRPEDAVQGLEAGANDYLAKPFWRQEMLARVAAQLRVQANEQMRWVLTEERQRSASETTDPRALLVELLTKSVQFWEMETGKSRADLAEESGLWTVTLDGSSRKTRTLDRYLDLETLPKRPRWGNVTLTARHVMETLGSGPRVDELKNLLERLESTLMS